MFTDEETQKLSGRFLLPLMGGMFSGDTRPQHFMVPFPGSPLKWNDIAYRVTIAFKGHRTLKETWRVVDVKHIWTEYEIAGPYSRRPSQRGFDSYAESWPMRTVTLFFGYGRESSATDSVPVVEISAAATKDFNVDLHHFPVVEVAAIPEPKGKPKKMPRMTRRLSGD